jgi:hypothetical protein
MVRAGQAVDYWQYSGGRYEPDQQRAKKNRAGIWAGTFHAFGLAAGAVSRSVNEKAAPLRCPALMEGASVHMPSIGIAGNARMLTLSC